jgi:hypothetical protein
MALLIPNSLRFPSPRCTQKGLSTAHSKISALKQIVPHFLDSCSPLQIIFDNRAGQVLVSPLFSLPCESTIPRFQIFLVIQFTLRPKPHTPLYRAWFIGATIYNTIYRPLNSRCDESLNSTPMVSITCWPCSVNTTQTSRRCWYLRPHSCDDLEGT